MSANLKKAMGIVGAVLFMVGLLLVFGGVGNSEFDSTMPTFTDLLKCIGGLACSIFGAYLFSEGADDE